MKITNRDIFAGFIWALLVLAIIIGLWIGIQAFGSALRSDAAHYLPVNTTETGLFSCK